jgi:hypothetical protein
MARAYKSSLHVPVEIDGVKGTLNFWSTEASAFPPSAVTLLEDVARAMTARTLATANQE